MRLLERVILKCEGSVVLKAIESTECVGDSEKARLGNTTFPELTFPNSGCRGAATLWLFRSETRVNFAFWLEAQGVEQGDGQMPDVVVSLTK